MRFDLIVTPIALALACCAPAWAAPSPQEALLEMADAFKKGQSQRLTALKPATQGHILEPWAAYWELRARLDTAAPEEIERFFQTHAGTYVEDRLRNDWLLQLGRARDWARFTQVLPAYRMQDDPAVRCYALAAGAPQPSQTAEVRALWLRPRADDDACTLAAGNHLKAGLLTAEDVWRKVRTAVLARQSGAAQSALALLAPELAQQLPRLLQQPTATLKTLPNKSSGTSQLEAATLALLRLAQTDPEEASHQLTRGWGAHLGPQRRAWVWGAIGMAAAQQRSPLALRAFAQAQGAVPTDEMRQWWARAALRAGDWTGVRQALEGLSDEAAAEPAWVYWRARALQALEPHNPQPAQHLLRTIAGPGGFYELLALETLGQPITPPAPPPAPSAAERAAARANPGLQRALAAIALGLRSEGVREWNYTTNLHTPGGMDDRSLLAAADLACQQQVWDRCINTSERTRGDIDMAQRYPMPLKDAVVPRARSIGLDPAFVYGLIRQESRFILDARSVVGASGLMQIMPKTAKWTAKKIGLTHFHPSQLADRDTNITLGTAYLKLVLDDMGGSLPMAAAAYNAGPGRPRLWRGQEGDPVLEAAIWAENIPFAETRDYVKKVLANTTWYAALLEGKPQSLLARLGQVGPARASSPVNPDLP